MDKLETRTPQFERERSRESRENKEAAMDPELKAAAAMERADYLVKEVKSNKKQIANIVIHINQVKKQIAQIRQLLALQHSNDDNSTAADEAQVQKLKKQIQTYVHEMHNMQGELEDAYIMEMTSQMPEASEAEIRALAKQRVSGLIGELKD